MSTPTAEVLLDSTTDGTPSWRTVLHAEHVTATRTMLIDHDVVGGIQSLMSVQPTMVTAGEGPFSDGRTYTTGDGGAPRCRPYLRVVESETAWMAGPDLRFAVREDGTYLTVRFEEDVSARVGDALPFDVRVTGVALAHGPGLSQSLEFANLIVRPGDDPATGPAFRVEAEAKVPPDRQEQLVRDLQGPALAEWVVGLELDWVQPVPPPVADVDLMEAASAALWYGGPADPGPGLGPGAVPLLFNGNDGDSTGFVILGDAYLEDGGTYRSLRTHPMWIDNGSIAGFFTVTQPMQAMTLTGRFGFLMGADGTDGAIFRVFVHNQDGSAAEVFAAHKPYAPGSGLSGMSIDLSAYSPVQIQLRVDTGPSSGRDWAAWVELRLSGRVGEALAVPQVEPIERRMPADYPDTGRNTAVYASVSGTYAPTRWQSSQHGWFQPTVLRETVYVLPDAYLLQVDAVSGLPALQALLLRRDGADPAADSLDPTIYTTRLTVTAVPTFTPGRLGRLRELIRRQSTDAVKYAELAIGGYRAARFVADEGLAGLGSMIAGTTAADREGVDPARSFTLTYQGTAEFVDLLYKRLADQGIGGELEFDLDEPGDEVHRLRVPVTLSFRTLAPAALPVELVAPDGAGPVGLRLTNPTRRRVTVNDVAVTALQRSAMSGSVLAWSPGRTEPSLGGTVLEPGATTTVALRAEQPGGSWNGWDVELGRATPELASRLVLNELFDATTTGVRGWLIRIDSPPLEFFDRLTPEEQAPLADVVAIDVEVRRAGSTDTEDARLTREAPRSQVLLSRTVADFLGDRATGRSAFEWRRRLLRVSRPDDWSDWRAESGDTLSVYTT